MFVCFSVCPSAWKNSALTGRILMKLNIWGFFENLSRKFKCYQNVTRITGTLHEDVFTCMTLSRWVLPKIRIVLNKRCREIQSRHFISSNIFLENGAVYEIMSKNLMESERTQMSIRRRLAFWISKATRAGVHARARAPPHTHMHTRTPSRARAHRHTHTQRYVILIAFPL